MSLINEPYIIKPFLGKDDKFAIPSYIKENCKKTLTDIIVVVNNKTMIIKHNELDKLLLKVHPTSHNSYHGGVYHNLEYQFQENITGKLSEWDLKLLDRFHYTWLNKIPYIRTSQFRITIIDVNTERTKYKVYPKKNQMFSAFEMDADKIKVVILGKDPYPSFHANGLAFSSDNQDKPYALKQIEKALQKDYETSDKLQNNLYHWKQQGVLLLNTSFTVKENDIGSHLHYWKSFTKGVVKTLSLQRNQIVWILLGGDAQNMGKYIKGNNQIIIEAEHPSSSYYNGGEWLHNNCFRKCNEYLENYHTFPIKWI